MKEYNYQESIIFILKSMGCDGSTPLQHPIKKDESPSPPPSTKKYLRKNMIGKGTYGTVYRCISSENNQQYAMKVIKINGKTRKDVEREISNIKNEIRMLKKLQHQNIVKYESFEVDGETEQVEMVVQYVRGGSLKEFVESKGKLTERQVVRICKQILNGLVYLHSQNIMHRDLKCANVLLTQDQTVKITDFGTAKFVIAQDHDDIAKISASLKGTPYYMAPEILKRTGYNKSADIWSFGCLVIEMLTGKPPWTTLSANFEEIIGLITSNIHPPIPPNISKECQYFLQSCLDPIANKRLEARELLKHRFIERKTQNYGDESPRRTVPKSSSKQISNYKELTIEDIDEQQNLLSLPKKLHKINFRSSPVSKLQKNREGPLPKQTETNYAVEQLNQIVAEIQQLSDENISLQKNYYIKKRNNIGKQPKKKHKTRTQNTIKNPEQNLILSQSQVEINPQGSIASHERSIIESKISKMQRDAYLQKQKQKKKRKQKQKMKWEQQLKQAANFYKEEFPNRYHI